MRPSAALSGPVLAALAIAACLPSYSLVEGTGGVGGGATTSSTSATSTTSTSTSSSSGAGGAPCVDTTCDPLNCGAAGHDCLGGACVNATCQPVDVAVAQRGGEGIAVSGARVYWSELSRSVIASCPLAGCGAKQGDLVDIATAQQNPRQVAITTTHVYWTDFAANGGLRRCLLPDCAGGPQTIYEGATPPISLAVDESWVYFGLGFGGADGAVMRCSLEGCGAGGTSVITYASQLLSVSMVAVSAQEVFWLDDSQHVFKCPLAGCAGAPEAAVQGSVSAIAADDAWLYWGAGNASGGIYKCPLAGCGAGDVAKTFVAKTATRATTIVTDVSGVYWIEMGSPGTVDGLVMRAGKDGSKVTTLAAAQAVPVALAVDATTVWWLNRGVGEMSQIDGGVRRVAK